MILSFGTDNDSLVLGQIMILSFGTDNDLNFWDR